MTTRSEQGPYLSAAFFCERVLIEQDGVKSAIRIIDRITRTVVHPNPPAEMEPFDYELCMLIKFKSGRARGTHTLEIRGEKPSGEGMPSRRISVLFEGEDDRGVDSIGRINIRLDQVGLYWFDIFLGDRRITRIPLRVIYLPQVSQMPPGSDNRSLE